MCFELIFLYIYFEFIFLKYFDVPLIQNTSLMTPFNDLVFILTLCLPFSFQRRPLRFQHRPASPPTVAVRPAVPRPRDRLSRDPRFASSRAPPHDRTNVLCPCDRDLCSASLRPRPPSRVVRPRLATASHATFCHAIVPSRPPPRNPCPATAAAAREPRHLALAIVAHAAPFLRLVYFYLLLNYILNIFWKCLFWARYWFYILNELILSPEVSDLQQFWFNFQWLYIVLAYWMHWFWIRRCPTFENFDLFLNDDILFWHIERIGSESGGVRPSTILICILMIAFWTHWF